MKDVDARVHIYAVTALGRVGWLAQRSYAFTLWKAPVFILQEAEWTPKPDPLILVMIRVEMFVQRTVRFSI